MKNYRTYALRLLSIRQRSEAELRKRLREKGASPQEIEGIISSFKELGLIDDMDFAREFIRSKAVRHWSWYRIKSTLKYEFGVKDSIIDSLKNEYPDEIVIDYYVRRFRREGKPIEKIRQFLLRKGFSHDFIRRVLEKLSDIV